MLDIISINNIFSYSWLLIKKRNLSVFDGLFIVYSV